MQKSPQSTGNGRPPRPKAHKPSAAWSMNSPYAAPVRASPRAAKLVQQESKERPKRPLSAQISSTTSSRMAQTSPRPNSARPVRPQSASQARYMQLETIAFPMENSSEFNSCGACLSPNSSDIEVVQESDSTAMHLKLQALLEMWGEEHLGFRSSALFCETSFKQAKALATRMPHPNAFLSAVTFACLTQMGVLLEGQYPFLSVMIKELGTAVYSNFSDLQHRKDLEELTQHQSTLLFDHGKPWFQEVSTQKMRCRSFQTSMDTCKSEVLVLKEMLQEARNANTAAVTSAILRAPSQREQLDDYYIPPVLQLEDLSLESLSEEVLNVFTKISNADARHLLALLLENAVERDMTKLPDILAATIGNMKGQDRRIFLRECFDYVTPSELQDSLHGRDEINDDKKYQALVDDLHELLQLKPQEDGDSKSNSSATVALFHSEEARIGKRVHEFVELVEDVAAEVSLFELKHQALFTEPLLERLRRFECPVKRLKKQHELSQQKPRVSNEEENPQCECVCGRHRLVDVKEDEIQSQTPVQNEPGHEEGLKKQKPRRRSSVKRPLSAPTGRRKNAISFNARFGSPRKSSVSIHVFPLAEVCHLLSAILHLQFSRDAVEPFSSRREEVSALMFDDRFEFLKPDAGQRTFKTLAKDYLTRKYGIKSIAVMHTMQLERSLLHYTEKDNHVRCELFSWFFGADKARSQSKDYAFTFFQKLTKCLLNLFAAKKTPRSNSITSSSPVSPPLAYSALITTWAECLGDGDPTNPRVIATTIALESCKQVFPPVMQRNSHFISFREELYRQGVEQKTVGLEEFLHGAMEAWQLVFDEQMKEATKTVEAAGVLNPDGFARCLIANELEFTTGERYELFDLLTQEADESVVPSKKMAMLIMEAKYLRPTVPTSTYQ
ncbi:hypothetical protein P3T76_008249 [Phytophthora citrophthora]|uniref:Uncharacterized protein n=1 Tax=Phytophthora citrophthora TaxID=4793 RepID=A0AAD9GK92_9STRA|nr:hypothetical protein P3T76_008249 [Phytophthora citrophthora]